MKQTFLLFVFFIYGMNLLAEKIVLTFKPKNEANSIDSIVAINKVTGEKIKLIGTNTFNLNSLVSSANLVNNTVEDIAYPNPFHEKTIVKFFSKQKDKVQVILTNPLGQDVDSKNYSITNGIHKFEITGNTTGIYIVSIKSVKGVTSFKMICLQDNTGKNQINYIGFSKETDLEKSLILYEEHLIHFRIYSGKHITVIADTPTQSKTYDVEFVECDDNDGKSYAVVQIGEQWWMAENLAYLPEVNLSYSVSTEKPRYSVNGYNGTDIVVAKQQSNYTTYGVLYNWTAAKASCPPGWHLPTNEEWEQLAQYVSNNKGPYLKTSTDWFEVGTHLKATSGWILDGNGTDDFGFSGLSGGYYNGFGDFILVGYVGSWWSATEVFNYDAWFWNLVPTYTSFGWYSIRKDYGFSVRCIRD